MLGCAYLAILLHYRQLLFVCTLGSARECPGSTCNSPVWLGRGSTLYIFLSAQPMLFLGSSLLVYLHLTCPKRLEELCNSSSPPSRPCNQFSRAGRAVQQFFFAGMSVGGTRVQQKLKREHTGASPVGPPGLANIAVARLSPGMHVNADNMIHINSLVGAQ